MSNNFKFLILLIAAFAVVGCSSPVGSIGGYGAGTVLVTVPNRVNYDVGDPFQYEEDLEVFTSSFGVVQNVPIENCDIMFINDPNDPDAELEPLPNNMSFGSKGRRIIRVEYIGLNSSYSIDVWDPQDLGGNTPNSGDKGIFVIWPDDTDK